MATAARPEAAKLSCEVSFCSCEVSGCSCELSCDVFTNGKAVLLCPGEGRAAESSHLEQRSYLHIAHRSLVNAPLRPLLRPHLSHNHIPLSVFRISVCPRLHLKLERWVDAFDVPKGAFGAPQDAFDVPKGAFGVPNENETIGTGTFVDAGPFGFGAGWPSCTVRSGTLRATTIL